MATHSSVLAWRILWTEEPGGLPSMGLHRVGHDWSDLAAAAVTSDVEHLFMCLMAICPSLSPPYSCCSVTKPCFTLCDPMDCSTPGFSVLHTLLELAQIHVHWVVMLSNHLIPCHPLFLLSSIFPGGGNGKPLQHSCLPPHPPTATPQDQDRQIPSS